jgi:hypothetical protein
MKAVGLAEFGGPEDPLRPGAVTVRLRYLPRPEGNGYALAGNAGCGSRQRQQMRGALAVPGLVAPILCVGGLGFGRGLLLRAAVCGGPHVDEPGQGDAD